MMEQGRPEETLAEIGGLGWLGTHAAQLHFRQVGEDPAQRLRRVGQAAVQAGVPVEVRVRELGSRARSLAQAMAAGERSTASTVNPAEARCTALRPGPQPKSSARPGVTMERSR